MKHLFQTLIFFGCFWGQLLKCHAQFNTVTRDSVPVQLIGQPSQQSLSIGSNKGQGNGILVTGDSSILKGSSEKGSRMVSGDGKVMEDGSVKSGTSVVGERSVGNGTQEKDGTSVLGEQEGEKYYEMPDGAMRGMREGKKKNTWLRRLFGRSSEKEQTGGGLGRSAFGKKRKRGPQVIIIPIQTVGEDVAGSSGGSGGRERIDEYSEERETLLFRELKAEDLRRLDLLSQRSTVSMPLQRFYLTSKFGYRKDPLGQGTRFHDGVDLRCSYEPVFAMLPGVVTKVQYGNTGYGNYVVLNHGNIECLYGHLSDIGVEVGEAVQAGDVVAISGNTGRSTGPHLHVKMTYMGQRVDPLVFIDYINDYIHQLQSQLYGGSDGSSDISGGMELNIENLIAAMQHYGLHHQSVVLAQAWLETGKFTSDVCRYKHNLFGLTRRDGQYYEFENWQESVKGYRDMIQYRYKGGDYYEFLRKLPYAEDPNYIFKVKQIESQLGGYGLGLGEGGE